MADYDSAFDTESESERQIKDKRNDLIQNVGNNKKPKVEKSHFVDEYSKEEGRKRRFHYLSLDAYSRHKLLVNEYLLTHAGSTSKLTRDTSRDKTEYDVLRENHRFLWDDDDDDNTWEKRVAKRYYDKLFKEYCICDLSRYKENRVAMRWRIEREVIEGKGQFICGEKTCHEKDALKSWEVNFSYVEMGLNRNALVKCRLCPQCSAKLNYRHQRKEAKKIPRKGTVNTSHDQTQEDKNIPDNAILYADDHSDKSESDSKQISTDVTESNIWSGPSKVPELEKSIDDEFDDYLQDLML